MKTRLIILAILTFLIVNVSFSQIQYGTEFRHTLDKWSFKGDGENLVLYEPENNNLEWAVFEQGYALRLTGIPNLYTDGYVRIGGNLNISGGRLLIDGSNHIVFGHSNGHGVINFGDNGIGNLYFRSLPVGGEYGPNYNQLMLLTYDGKLGIGTTNPGNYKLAVNGSIRAKSIDVETGWSDFVFEPDYKLMSLEDLEKYILKNGHLPDIPSAEEVEMNGVNLGETQSKLLQKIEELTLYMISLNKANIELRKKLSVLEDQLELKKNEK